MAERVREGTAGAEAKGRTAGAEVEIDAGREAVWRALTDARELERWFPLEARVRPGEGGSLWMSWKNEFSAEMRIDVWEPPRRLVTSWGFGEGDGQVTEYTIESRGGRAVVRAVTSGFPEGARWDDWVEGTNRGWRFELRSLKHYLERHDGEERGVVYLRRRVALERREAWATLMEALPEEAKAGDVFDRVSDWQHAAVVSDPADGLLRFSVEPGQDGEARDVTVWLSAWGGAREALPAHERRWRALLEETFPEGQTV